MELINKDAVISALEKLRKEAEEKFAEDVSTIDVMICSNTKYLCGRLIRYINELEVYNMNIENK